MFSGVKLSIRSFLLFWKALTKTFRMIYHLARFADVSTFPLFSLMTSLDVIQQFYEIFKWKSVYLLQGYITTQFGSFNCCNSKVKDEKLKKGYLDI